MGELVRRTSVVFLWWSNKVRLYSLYEVLYPKRRIESYSILGTIVPPQIKYYSLKASGYRNQRTVTRVYGLGHRDPEVDSIPNPSYVVPFWVVYYNFLTKNPYNPKKELHRSPWVATTVPGNRGTLIFGNSIFDLLEADYIFYELQSKLQVSTRITPIINTPLYNLIYNPALRSLVYSTYPGPRKDPKNGTPY